MIKIITIITKFILATLLVLSIFSCGYSYSIEPAIKCSGNISNETRALSQDFKSIKVSNGIKVIIEQTQNKSVTVEADDNVLKTLLQKLKIVY